MKAEHRLRLLPYGEYPNPDHEHDPVRYYYWPVLGPVYRRRVENCLAECAGGERVLEVGYGSGVTFLNLRDRYREIHGVDLSHNGDAIAAAFRVRGIETSLKHGNVLDLPYPDGYFDTVLLISILEHLKPAEQDRAFSEICRVLKPGGQVVYGVPVERPLMVTMFRLLGHDIRQHHFSTEADVRRAALRHFTESRVVPLRPFGGFAGKVYEVGHFVKAGGQTLDVWSAVA